MPVAWPRGRDLTIGNLSPQRTDLLERACAAGWPLDDMCPHPACTRTEHAAWEWGDAILMDTVIVEFHPCGHRYWPTWRVRSAEPSRFLNDPVSRRRCRWWKPWERP